MNKQMDVKEKVEELQQAILQEYGVSPQIEINIYSHWEENKHVDGEESARIFNSIAKKIGGECKKFTNNGTNWHSIEKGNVSFTSFFYGVEDDN